MARGKVLIVYKSGAKVEIECDDFTVRKNGPDLREVTWVMPSPKPMLIGVNDIAAIYDLGDSPDAVG